MIIGSMFFDVLCCAVVLLLFYRIVKLFSISFGKNVNNLPKKMTKEIKRKDNSSYCADNNSAN